MPEARLQETVEYKPGTFCWVELATTDGEAAKQFYSELFGWTGNDMPVGPGMTYTILLLDGKEGKDVGALFQMPPEMAAQGIPPNWLSYVSVTNADESAAKAKELGATLMREPVDVMQVGRMAVIQDPTGAVFAIWQAGEHKGAGAVNVPGSFVWNELATTDTAKDGAFYNGLFGWNPDAKDFGGFQYTILQHGDEKGAGGMYELTPEMAGVPSNWLVYFSVDDCDATVAKATELGGKTIKPAEDTPGVGRFAVLQDPQGAYFAVIKTEPMPA